MKNQIRNVVLLITCVVCLLFMFGCKKEKGNEKLSTSIETNKVTTNSKDDIQTNNSYISNDVSYVIKTKSIVTTNINVNYPQIVGCENDAIELKWNEIIRNKVESEMNYIGSRDKYFLSYEVMTQNEEMISLLMLGETVSASSENTSIQFKYTYNIDLESGEGIRLKDRGDTQKIAENLIKGKKYSLVDSSEEQFHKYITTFYDSKELMDELNEYDFGESLNYAKGYSYYQNGKVYVCMNVNHNLGDWIEILIDN